jgi:hypothetical protein
MGERIPTQIDILGEISTVDSFNSLVDALAETGDIRIGGREVAADAGAIRQALVDANREDKPLRITCYNWGDTDLFEAAGKGIDLRIRLGGYGGSGPRVFFFKAGRKSLTLTEDSGEVAISHKLVRQFMYRGVESLAELDDFLSLYCAEEPDFRISDDVLMELYVPNRNRP